MDNHSNGTQKALRGAAAAANIARGAATGGIYGAAAGAAKSFLPEIALLLCMTILIPMLVFTALPNIAFGYDSARDQDIVDFTGSAHALDRLYQDLAQKDQTVIDRLIEAVLPDFWREGTAQYDSWSVTQDLGHTNRYWLIATGSVRYRQDLYAMDGAALEALLYDKLTYSATLVERVLHISVQDLSPQAYMDALGFTQEEKDWAALLYSVLAEEQYTGTEDSDGTGYWNTDCRALRLRYGISHLELARAAGVSRQLISKIELEPSRQTPGHEKLLQAAFAAAAAQRRARLEALERDLERWQGKLFQPEKGEDGYGQ